MVETNSNQRSAARSSSFDRFKLNGAPSPGLLQQYVFSRGDGLFGHDRQHVVSGSDENNVHVSAGNRLLPIHGGAGAVLVRQRACALQIDVATNRHDSIRQCLGTFAADQAAADDRHPYWQSQFFPRSAGTMRRKV